MNAARQIIFGPGDKLAWLEGVAFDAKATPLEARIAIALSNRIDKFTGKATVDQVWLGAKIDADPRSVRRALERMASRGHLAIEHSRGRGKANVYHPTKRGPQSRYLVSEKRTLEAVKEDSSRSKRGPQSPPLPNNYQNSSSVTGDDNDPNNGPWLSVRKGIAAHIGADMEAAAWFGRLSVEAITPAEVVMHAPSAFMRQSIEGRWPDRLLIEWRRELPSVERVRLVLPMQRAAE